MPPPLAFFPIDLLTTLLKPLLNVDPPLGPPPLVCEPLTPHSLGVQAAANPSVPAPAIGSMARPATCVAGKLTYNQGPRQRNLDVTLEYCAVRGGSKGPTEVVMFEV